VVASIQTKHKQQRKRKQPERSKTVDDKFQEYLESMRRTYLAMTKSITNDDTRFANKCCLGLLDAIIEAYKLYNK
jgi:hypothetical protein